MVKFKCCYDSSTDCVNRFQTRKTANMDSFEKNLRCFSQLNYFNNYLQTGNGFLLYRRAALRLQYYQNNVFA